jgi:hypothetical protein
LAPSTVADWDPVVRERLAMLGFFKLLGTQIGPELRSRTPDNWIPFTSGELTLGDAARRLRERLERHLGAPIGMRQEIYASLVEAMKNAFQHAYPDDHAISSDVMSRVGRRWWMTGRVDREHRTVELAFLDQGITIPVSLPRSWMWEDLKDLFGGGHPSDAFLLVEAMQRGRSRLSGQSHRGKGFADIRHPARLHPDNELRVLSRAAHYVLRGSEGAGRDVPIQFNGTLLEWRIHARPKASMS